MVIMCHSINVIGPSISKVYQIGIIHSGRQRLSVLHKILQLARSIVEIQIQTSLLFRLLKLYRTIYLPFIEGNQAYEQLSLSTKYSIFRASVSFIGFTYLLYLLHVSKEKKKVRHTRCLLEKGANNHTGMCRQPIIQGLNSRFDVY